MTENSSTFALVLGGGNALGAYQAGIYQALHEAGWVADLVVGTSAGAINGALIVGNEPNQQIARLREFWRPGAADTDDSFWPSPVETLRRTTAALTTLGFGRPGVFGPIGPFGSWWDVDARATAPSLFDTKPLATTLARLVNFARLNAGVPRYVAGAVDLDRGDDRWFDSARETITPDHVRASAALLPAFPPVEIDGRAYVDGGLSANLPLDPVLGSPAAGATVCVAVDLLPMAGRPPQSVGEAATRAQDLIFAAQSRRTIERWQTAYDHEARLRSASVTLVRLAYHDHDAEVAGKAMDFSPVSIRHRWDAGYRDASALLDRFSDGLIPIGEPGLTVIQP